MLTGPSGRPLPRGRLDQRAHARGRGDRRGRGVPGPHRGARDGASRAPQRDAGRGRRARGRHRPRTAQRPQADRGLGRVPAARTQARGRGGRAHGPHRARVRRGSNKFVTDLLGYSRERDLALETVDLGDHLRGGRAACCGTTRAAGRTSSVLLQAGRPAGARVGGPASRCARCGSTWRPTPSRRWASSGTLDDAWVAPWTTGWWRWNSRTPAPGIAAEDLPRVGEPFFTTKRGGTGLGLAIAQRIVERHGGVLTLESEAGRGTTARVQLPALRRGRGRGRVIVSFRNSQNEVNPMAAEKILVVDDEQSMTQFLGIVLRKEGYQVTTVNSGRDALERVKAEPFDVVISDIKMPGMDGIQLLAGHQEARRQHPGRADDGVRLAAVRDRCRQPGRVPVPAQERQERRDQARRAQRARDATRAQREPVPQARAQEAGTRRRPSSARPRR